MSKWTLLGSETLLNSPWMTVLKNSYEVVKGAVTDNYYVIQRADFVVVVALVGDNVVLIRQYRPATDRTYLCLPAGYIDQGESPEAAAIRELFEETGYQGFDARLIGRLDPLPGYVRSRAHIVSCQARRTSSTLAQNGGESIQILECVWDDALQRIASGEIDEMQAVSALLLANMTGLDHHAT